MRKEFTLTIELGNAAMQSPYDVMRALHRVTDRVEMGEDGGVIRDLNGNTVGHWTAAWPEPEPVEA